MFRELFDTAPDAMIVVDPQGHIVRANAQATRLFGFAESELIGQPVDTLMPNDVRTAHRAHFAGYAHTPRVRPMGSGQELVGQRKDGTRFPVEIALSPLKAPDGQLFLASVRDVSETQRARQALARARYDSFLSQISQSILSAMQLDAALERVPETLVAALSLSAAAVMSKDLSVNRMRPRAVFGASMSLFESLSWHRVIDAAVDGDGVVALDQVHGFATAIAMPLFDRSEVVGALVALNRDARAFDRDALNFFQSVAHLLAGATQRSRVEEQLSHAQRLEAVGQLTGGVAHDFNNLLTVISGNLQLLEEELGDKPEAQEIIGAALGAVKRGADLTRKLLAFARKQRLSPEDLDPSRVLGELGGMLRRTLGETVQLEAICAPNIAHVYADPSQLEAALVNLALNARDAMPRGGRLTLQAEHAQITADEATPDLPAGDYIVFSVRDTGMGMTPETLARAFEPFFTTKDSGKGSGLGLSMVYGFVKQSQGHLRVESRLGYGTSMRIYLPMSRETAQPAAAKVRVSQGNETVLIVEDEGDVRRLAERFLTALGYRVLSAANPETAMQRLNDDASIALLFSDVVLGTGMNGAELAAEAQSVRPGLRVLLASGYEHVNGDENPIAQRYPLLQKPYRREDLAEAVRKVLDAH